MSHGPWVEGGVQYVLKQASSHQALKAPLSQYAWWPVTGGKVLGKASVPVQVLQEADAKVGFQVGERSSQGAFSPVCRSSAWGRSEGRTEDGVGCLGPLSKFTSLGR